MSTSIMTDEGEAHRVHANNVSHCVSDFLCAASADCASRKLSVSVHTAASSRAVIASWTHSHFGEDEDVDEVDIEEEKFAAEDEVVSVFK